MALLRPFSIGLLLIVQLASGAVPVFTRSFTANGQPYSYTVVGTNPESGVAATIPTVMVPLVLSFEAGHVSMSASSHVSEVRNSPIFQPFPFADGVTQYADAVQRAEFYKAAPPTWHTLLSQPQLLPAIHIDVPAANGYVLHSRNSGNSLAIVDLDFVQKQLFQQLGTSIGPGKLVIALTHNVAFYALGDATVCCSVGTHGLNSSQPFVLASYFDPGAYPHYTDIQGITQQIAEWMNDPLLADHPNEVPRWLEPPSNVSCGGRGESSSYLLEQPTDYLPESATQVNFHGKVYHLENMALLPWFAQTAAPETFQSAYSFPNTKALPTAAQPCSSRRNSDVQPTAAPAPRTASSNGHALIGYWEGYASARSSTPLRDVSPQWDIIIATFAAPVKGSTSLLRFEPPAAIGEERFKSDVAFLQSQGKKVLISLGGGGEVVTLNTPEDLHNFITSVSEIVEKYGFDGVDLDIETPSLLINPGDTDFRRPTTPSIVNLISAMRQMRQHFGPKFMISEVPEAAQTQAGMQAYGGQFGSFLPVIYGTRDILSFVDAQDYNTPPLEGLDGNYYFPGKADYHVALSEMLVHGFPVGGDPKAFFPPLPPNQVAIGLPATPTSARNYTPIPAIEDALRYLIEGKSFPGAEYKLRQSAGYPSFLGAMFWAINEDRRNNYRMSNAIGPFLHNLPAAQAAGSPDYAAGSPHYLGPQPCALCHKDIAAQQARTAMANTWQGRMTSFLPASFNASVTDDLPYRIKRSDGLVTYSLDFPDGPKLSYPVDILMGGRRHGLGFLIPIHQVGGIPLARPALIQARYAWSPEKGRLLLAPGCSAAKPSSLESALGVVLSPTFESRCVGCHGQPGSSGSGVNGGVHCEACHGPGSAHLASISRGHPEQGIINPHLLSNEDSIAICARCHVGLTRFSDPSPDDLLIANQVRAIKSSECYLQSGKAFSCTTCHDPHNDAADDRQATRACLGCHAQGVQRHAAICPVNSAAGCVGCHMPSTDQGALHLVDHLIRVHPEEGAIHRAAGRSQVPPVSEYLRTITTQSAEAAAVAQRRLNNGDSFYAVARDISVDRAASIGGYLGRKPLSELGPDLSAAAARLDYGEASPVLHTAGQWIVLQRLPRDFRWDAEQLQRKAEELASHGDAVAAIEKAQQALMIYPHFLRALSFIGVAFGQNGNPKRGGEVLATALRLYPDDAGTEFALASVRAMLGDQPGAKQAYQQVISLEPDFTAAYVNLGMAYYSSNELPSAIQTFRQGLQIDPLSAELNRDLGQALVKSGDLAAGNQTLKLAQELDLTHLPRSLSISRRSRLDGLPSLRASK